MSALAEAVAATTSLSLPLPLPPHRKLTFAADLHRWHHDAMGMLFRSISSSPPLMLSVNVSGVGQQVTRESAAQSLLTLSYMNAGLFGMIMTAPDRKLDNLLWYAMPNLLRLAHGMSNKELTCAKLALKALICSLYNGYVVL